MTGAKALVVAAATALGAFLAVGCVLAALFEAQGFGGERDTDPRTGYLLLLALGLVASIGVPWLLWRRLLPQSAPAWPLFFGAALIGVVVILGVGFG